MLLRLLSNRNSLSIWWECKIEQSFEDTLAVAYKTLPVGSSNHIPWHLPKWIENVCIPKSQNVSVYSGFIYNCWNLEATNMSSDRWMDKLWCICMMKYYSVMKKKLSNHEKIWRKFRCILLSERIQSEKAIYCIIPTIRHSKKVQTIQIAKI
jgi:hypothetical protein